MKRKALLSIGLVLVLLAVIGLDFTVSRSHGSSSMPSNPVAASTGPAAARSSAVPPGRDRILIAFFSRSGTNYPDVTLKIGHTEQIANEIARITGGTEFKIDTQTPYPKNYQATVDQAEREQQQNSRPAIRGPLPDLSHYDTIFLGYPIWWTDVPMAVRTFMDQENMNGKTVIPFSTNAGSGWGDSLETIRRQYPSANLRDGFDIAGEQADDAQSQVDQWLTKLGYEGE